MKKLFSRIVCIFSILVIMIPVFSLIVSANETTEPTKSKFYNECYQPNESYFDNRTISVSPIATMGSSREQYYGDCLKNTEQGAGKFYFSNYDDMLKNGDSHIYYEFNNYSGYKGYYGYKFDFASCLNYLYTHVESSLFYRSDFEDFKGKFLYVYYYKLNRSDDFSSDFSYKFYFSFSHLHFNTTNPDCIYLESETPIGEASLFIECDGGKIIDRTFSLKDYDSWTNDTKSTLYYKSTDTNYGLPYSIHKGDLNKYNSLNCHLLTAPNVSCTEFTFLEDADNKKIIGINIENDEFSEYEYYLSDLVDLELKPDFKMNMDRSVKTSDSFDTTISDYWQFNVINNSDVNIQFQLFVVPANSDLVTSFNPDELYAPITDSRPLNTTGFIPKTDSSIWIFEKEEWIYSKDVSSQETWQSTDGFKVHKPTVYHFVEAGGSYKQTLKWNQLSLNKNQPYELVLSVAECRYDKATDIHISVSDEYFENEYVIPKEAYYLCKDIKFSVINPLPYDSTEKYGNVIPNTGKEGYEKNDYWKINAIEKDGEVEVVNKNFSNTWQNNMHGGNDGLSDSPDVDFDLDNLNIDNVKSYVKSCSSFFKVLKTALTSFPAFIWVLICFGITALIVIGIVKAIL